MDKETEALIEVVAHDAAKKACHDTLISLGIDPDNPLDSQKDFARLREILDDPELVDDFAFIREFRKAVTGAKTKSWMTMLGLVITGAAWMLWTALTGSTPGG